MTNKVRSLIAVGLLAAIAVLTACGSGEGSGNTGAQATLGPAAARGESLFRGEGCSACHRTNDRRLVGPGLAGIAERRDAAYIRQSIREPGAVVVDGFNNVMPAFNGLSDEQIDDLIAYLDTLR